MKKDLGLEIGDRPGISDFRFPTLLLAFSLVEVVLALGIVSFSLLAVVGLLPVGLRSIKNANEQAAAANVVGAISAALRAASSTDGTNFTNTFSGENITYLMGGANASTNKWTNLDLSGTPGTSAKRLSALLEIVNQPGTNPPTPGRAVISVAWPAQADPEWHSANQTWTKAEGSLTTAIQFLPK